MASESRRQGRGGSNGACGRACDERRPSGVVAGWPGWMPPSVDVGSPGLGLDVARRDRAVCLKRRRFTCREPGQGAVDG
jgi:hypothetical protein